MERNKHYRLLVDEKQSGGKWFVQLLDGIYAGVLVRFIRFQFATEENPDGTRHFRFEHEVVSVPDHLEGVLLPDSCGQDFVNLLGEILVSILADYFKDTEPAADDIDTLSLTPETND